MKIRKAKRVQHGSKWLRTAAHDAGQPDLTCPAAGAAGRGEVDVEEPRVREQPHDGPLLRWVGGIHEEECGRLALQPATLPVNGPSVNATGTQSSGEPPASSEDLQHEGSVMISCQAKAIALKDPIVCISRCRVSSIVGSTTTVKKRTNTARKIRNTKFANSVGRACAEGVVKGEVGSQK